VTNLGYIVDFKVLIDVGTYFQKTCSKKIDKVPKQLGYIVLKLNLYALIILEVYLDEY
jgi:hypothetical protein